MRNIYICNSAKYVKYESYVSFISDAFFKLFYYLLKYKMVRVNFIYLKRAISTRAVVLDSSLGTILYKVHEGAAAAGAAPLRED